jgi:hypothetical protein
MHSDSLTAKSMAKVTVMGWPKAIQKAKPMAKSMEKLKEKPKVKSKVKVTVKSMAKLKGLSKD